MKYFNFILIIAFGLCIFISCEKSTQNVTIEENNASIKIEENDASINSLEPCSETGWSWVQDDIDTFIYYSAIMSKEFFNMDSTTLFSTFDEIESFAITTNTISEYSDSVSTLLNVDYVIVNQFLEWYGKNPHLGSLEYSELINQRIISLLSDETICLERFKFNSLQSRACNIWEAAAAVLGAAGSLVSCAACISGVLPSCVPCITSAGSSAYLIKKCFFDD